MIAKFSSNLSIRFHTVVILLLTLGGFGLRLRYLLTAHPFFDEYTTVLAARQILEQGRPILPSGLFYEHGLLATYLIAPFTALFIDMPPSDWQPAHWGLMLSRWPSLLVGTVTIPLLYVIGRRCSALTGGSGSQKLEGRGRDRRSDDRIALSLLAAGLFAFSPEGMVWGGRARMYALATLLVVVTVSWAYRGALYPAPAAYRWGALLTLLAALLTQFGVMLLIPPLLAAMVVGGWLSWPRKEKAGPGGTAESRPLPRIWFWRPSIFLEGGALAAVIGLAVFVKRLGRPLGVAPLSESVAGESLAVELFRSTIAYQITFHFTWADTVTFLSRQFGVPHHFWLTLITLTGLGLSAAVYLARKQISDLPIYPAPLRPRAPAPPLLSPLLSPFLLFLGLIFGLLILQTVTLLEPFRRNPRYIVIYLPLFYLIAAGAILNVGLISRRLMGFSFPTSFLATRRASIAVAVIALALFTAIGYKDLQTALITPEPAYDKAFAAVYADRRPGDVVVAMNTPAAALYLGGVAGFTVQGREAAAEFLLPREEGAVDRWTGAPWIGSPAAFNALLNENERVWFVIDSIRLGSQAPAYFRGDWIALLNSQLEQVWAADNALVYRTRPDRVPLPTQPDTRVEVTLGDSIQLVGYTLSPLPVAADQSPPLPLENAVSAASGLSLLQSPPATSLRAGLPWSSPRLRPALRSGHREPAPTLHLTLFWKALAPLSTDYTMFLHLRDSQGATVAQRDGLPLQGLYPTSRWRPGEIVIDPITWSLPESLPPGSYRLVTGLYRLDTLERLPVAGDPSGEQAISLGKVVWP